MIRTRIVILLCLAVCLLCACQKSDEPWGTYRTARSADGNYKSVEFAYSKTFYTADAFAAEQQSDEERNDARLEGWYTLEGDQVKCTYTITDEEKTAKLEYVFRYQREQDQLVLISVNRDGKTTQQNEIYIKSEDDQ